MTEPIGWQKSSYSGTQGDCVEVAAVDGTIRFRESDTPAVVLAITPTALGTFLLALKTGEFGPTASA
jgi:hypothetical protein